MQVGMVSGTVGPGTIYVDIGGGRREIAFANPGGPFLQAGTWFHLAFTYDSATNYLHFYADGDGTEYGGGNNGVWYCTGQPATGPIATGDAGMLVWGPYVVGMSTGNIDNVFVFDTILTDAEILNLKDYNDVVPEPVTMTLLALGMPLIVMRNRRRR